jgi:UDP-N-acetylglucosamine/UDP-N-acetylgalactosamine diphosphorylase
MPATPLPFYSDRELEALAERGVRLPGPGRVAVGRDVPLERIAAGAVLHPFTRITGARTRIDAGAQIGPGGPATLDNAWIGAGAVVGALGPVTLRESAAGPGTVLGCGVAEEAVFLGQEGGAPGFTTGYGFRARKGTLYEEDANSAQHTDTKMTVLMPWVALGSNVNWCDILVAGGTGPGLGEFTEVGSGCVHFNFTPRGDKATGSALGSAVDGVFLDRPRLFVGGNGSLVGPLAADFGAVTLAGGRYTRRLAPGLNAADPAPPGLELDLDLYGSVKRVFDSQVHLIGELAALDAWYGHVRSALARGRPEREELYRRGREAVRRNLTERIGQLEALAGRMERSAGLLERRAPGDARIPQQRALAAAWPAVNSHLQGFDRAPEPPPEFLRAVERAAAGSAAYTSAVAALPAEARVAGRGWLAAVKGRVATPELLARVPALTSAR